MAELTPVPGPRSPFAGWRAWAVGIVVVGILVAIAKPWGPLAEDAPVLPGQAASFDPVAEASGALGGDEPSAVPVDRTVEFDAASLGARSPEPAWTLITAADRVALPIADMTDPSAAPSEGGGRPDISAGPVLELGTSDDAGALAIAHPRDASRGAVRLWRFATDGQPRRVDLDQAPSPWPVDHVELLVQREQGAAPDRAEGWESGLYRLDLLIEPEDIVRSVMLVVRPGPGSAPGAAPMPAEPAPERGIPPSTLRILPPAANLWALGGYLSGWHRDAASGSCRIVEIWQSTDPRDDCWPVPLGPTDAIGVNLDVPVTSIELALVDPLPGPAGATSQLAVGGRAGLAFVQAPAGGLADGIYRLDAGTAAGSRTWYLEVGPIGRAVARYYDSATSR